MSTSIDLTYMHKHCTCSKQKMGRQVSTLVAPCASTTITVYEVENRANKFAFCCCCFVSAMKAQCHGRKYCKNKIDATDQIKRGESARYKT